ncbi:MAG: LemA family protein [Armatimonadota bacterium]|nr:LemA family protein [bacterium]
MWIIIAAAGLILAYIIFTYNGFASLRNRARGAWADIDVQLKMRHDLVPNLVATVQGYAQHEKGVLEDVARLRSKAQELNGIGDIGGNEAQLSTAIKTLFAVAESYPQLRADAGFRDLQKQLTEIEEHIQYARRYYNAVVRDLNTKCDTFPSGIIGSWFGYRHLEYFQAADDDREAVKFNMGGQGQ